MPETNPAAVQCTALHCRDPLVYFYQKSMFYLCLPFVFECGYRSVLPRVDIPRLCLFDVWGNNVLFGRASAFIGEWCWMLQITLALRNILDGLASHKALWLNKLCTGERRVAEQRAEKTRFLDIDNQ